jgi:hypothetical protein
MPESSLCHTSTIRPYLVYGNCCVHSLSEDAAYSYASYAHWFLSGDFYRSCYSVSLNNGWHNHNKRNFIYSIARKEKGSLTKGFAVITNTTASITKTLAGLTKHIYTVSLSGHTASLTCYLASAIVSPHWRPINNATMTSYKGSRHVEVHTGWTNSTASDTTIREIKAKNATIGIGNNVLYTIYSPKFYSYG